MTNPTPYWKEPAWRKRHGFESIASSPKARKAEKDRRAFNSKKHEPDDVEIWRAIDRELGL